jgi:hypothetical protein
VDAIGRACRSEKVRRRLVFASGWYLNDSGGGLARSMAAVHGALASVFQAYAGLEADVLGRNALRFYGLLDDGGTQNHDRLARFYGGQPWPRWLGTRPQQPPRRGGMRRRRMF